MSLRARLRRCEAQIEWLDTYGPLRLCELQLKELHFRQQIEARLAAKPRDEAARRMGALMGLALPPLPEPPVVTPPPAPAPAGPPRDERVRDSSFADTTYANVVRVPPASWPPPPPPVDWEAQYDARTEEVDSS